MATRRKNGASGRYLPPVLLQSTGLVLLVGAALFWALTGHQSALVMSAALSLVALGAYSGIHVSVRQEIDSNRRRRAADETSDIELPD